MGQQQTKALNNNGIYNIPKKKNFKLSYCVQENVSELSEKRDYINLNNVIEEYTNNHLVMQIIYYKCKHAGYSLKEHVYPQNSYRIDHILEDISDIGLLLSNNVILNDIIIKRACYEPNLNNIYCFLNKGKILIGGIILTPHFIKSVLNMEVHQDETISDIVLIVGYDTDCLLLKTKWCEEIVKIENKYIKNLREIWNVEIETKN